jgi:hypothetical protein
MEKMNVSTAHYFVDPLTGENASIRATIDGQEMIVPLDPANRHYAEIMRQVDEGLLVIQEAE